MENMPYTREVIVFRKTLEDPRLDMTEPTLVMEDSAGHLVVNDGNHRECKAATTGTVLTRKIIGKIDKDVSKDPYYRKITDLRVVNFDPPDFSL